MKKEIDNSDDNGDDAVGDDKEEQTSVSQLLSSTLDLFLSIRPPAPPVSSLL